MKLPGVSITILLLFCSLCASAQEEEVIKFGRFFAKKAGGNAVLKGQITNPSTGDVMAGAEVFIEEIDVGTTSNENGNYALIIPIGEYTVQVRFIGHEPASQKIEIYDDGVLDFGLNAQSYSLREVVVEATIDDKNVRTASAGIAELKVKEIRALPTFLGEVDVVKSLLLLPGVSTIGEGAAGFNVRGGRIDQNLVQLNGASLFNTSHVLGFFSAFNPDIVDKFTLYKGSVPAQYGGRASSYLDVFAKSGDFERFKLKGGVGLISSRLTAEGPIVQDKTSFLVGARASYSDWLLGLVQQPEIRQSAASFYDANAIITHRINNNHQLTLSYYGSSDLFRYAQEFGYRYSTQLASLKWNGIFGSNFSTTGFLAIGDYKSNSFLPEGPESFDLDNGIRYYQYKQDFFYAPGKHTIHFGLEANIHQMKPDVLTPRNLNSVVLPETVEKDRSRDVAFYFNDEFRISDKFSINLGLRYSFFQQTGPDRLFTYNQEQPRADFTIIDTTTFNRGQTVKSYGGFEPRLSMRYEVGENASVKMSYNRIRQYIHLVTNTTAPTPVDIWQVSNTYIPPQIADNFSIGYFKNFNRNVWETSLEFYYKDLENLIDFADFPTLLLNENIETDLVLGQGRAYGGELYIRRKAGRWTGWLSYTYSRSEIRIESENLDRPINNGDWYPTNYDSPHNFTFVTKRQLGKKSFFSLNFTYRTGRPISGLISNYEQNNSPIPHFSERNQYRIPDYYRLDISFLFSLNKKANPKVESNLSLSIYNLLSRRNAFSVFYRRPDERILIPVAYQLAVLGSAFPSITYNFSF